MDPHLDAQVIYSQFQQGRETLNKKCTPKVSQHGNQTGDEDPVASGGRDSRSSNGGDGESECVGGRSDDEDKQHIESSYKELMVILDELAYHHSQVQVV